LHLLVQAAALRSSRWGWAALDSRFDAIVAIDTINGHRPDSSAASCVWPVISTTARSLGPPPACCARRNLPVRLANSNRVARACSLPTGWASYADDQPPTRSEVHPRGRGCAAGRFGESRTRFQQFQVDIA